MLIAPENTRSAFTLRRQVADMDYQEVVNYSFVEEAWEADFAQMRIRFACKILSPAK